MVLILNCDNMKFVSLSLFYKKNILPPCYRFNLCLLTVTIWMEMIKELVQW